MLYKNLPGASLWPLLLLRLIVDGLSAVPLLFRSEWSAIWAILRAHFAFYRLLGKFSPKRDALRITATTPVLRYPNSIIWAYFAKGKRKFSEL